MPKKRASRVGTRSVTSLTTVQLERKRANDREAQRAIRQRTKDHIDHLEQRIRELRTWGASSEQLVLATQYQNRELQKEVAFLRHEMNGAGLTPGHRSSHIAAALVDHQDASSDPLPAHRSDSQCDVNIPSLTGPSSSSSVGVQWDQAKTAANENAVVQDFCFPSNMTCSASPLAASISSDAGPIRATHDSMNWRLSNRSNYHTSSVPSSTRLLHPNPAPQTTNIHQCQASTACPKWGDIHAGAQVYAQNPSAGRPARFGSRPSQVTPSSGPFSSPSTQETLTQSCGQVDTMVYDPTYMLYSPTVAVDVTESNPSNVHPIAQTADWR